MPQKMKLIRTYSDIPKNGKLFYLNIYNFHLVLKNIKGSNNYFTFDGVGLLNISRVITARKIERLAPDLTSYFSIFIPTLSNIIFVGGKPGESDRISEKYSKGKTFSIHGFHDDKYIINALKAKIEPESVVIVGMGSPKQEVLINELHKIHPDNLFISCGAFFSQFSASEKYYPNWINSLNLRMPYRLIRERLYNRLPLYFINPFRFLLSIINKRIQL